MIKDDRQFEAALEEAHAILDAPPEPETEADEAFGDLLEAIRSYDPDAEVRAKSRRRLDELTLRIAELDRERQAGHPAPGSVGQGGGRFALPR